jgi:ABC-type sugar transport system ATPase subunit
MKASVEFKKISKFFPGVRALDSISFSAQGGTVYALLGENGAGKSTLLKILNGDYIPDAGEIVIDGKSAHFSKPKDAIDSGVSTIYQERQVLQQMSVAENVFLGAWPCKKGGMIDFNTMNAETEKIAERFGLDIKPDAKVRTLSVAMQQMVEIMKAVRRESQIIAFDEPTASLSDNEIDILFKIIRQLQSEGRVVFYVSHRMNEVGQIAQKVIVFKDGKLVGERDVDKTNTDELIQMLVGRSLGSDVSGEYKDRKIGDVIFSCDKLKSNKIHDISFSVKRGEILGFAGLVGAGRTEIMQAICGIDKLRGGTVNLDGKELHIKSPRDAIENGIVMVPEDRKDEGVLPNISVKGNNTV